MRLKAELIRSDPEFLDLAPAWRELMQAAHPRHPFVSFEWMWEWWMRWRAGRRLLLVALHDEDGLAGLGPFCLHPVFPGLSRLGFLADDFVGSDYLAPLVRPGQEEAAAAALAEVLLDCRREWDSIGLRDADGDSPTLARLTAILEKEMHARLLPASPCPYASLPRTFKEYLASLGASQRYNFRRRRRCLEEKGLELVKLGEPRDIARRLPELFRLHRLRFEQRGDSSVFLQAEAFHRAVVPAMARNGWVRFLELDHEGQAIAALYGFSMDGRFSFFQGGMDPAWSRHSAGMVLMGHSLEQAIRSGDTEYDFLQGDESYKSHWARQARYTRHMLFFDARIRSRAALLRWASRRRLGRWKTQLFYLAARSTHQLAGSSRR